MASLLARPQQAFARAAAKPAAARPMRLVVRAQAEKPSQQLAQLVKPALSAVVANALLAMPAAAEAGKIFDFNLTLPVMAGEFLLLMVFLEKAWFTPVGKVLDERDNLIRSKLGAVKDNTGDVDKLVLEAEAILKAARGEVSASINSQKNAKQSELDKAYNEAKAKITAEVDSAIAGLEKESAGMLQTLDAQVDKISAEVLKRVLPEGVKV
ncbi:CF0 ATP synthase subunit II precursor [Volvox carteri f. nagariensis]|uniref:CF0 ATP synthase subunit II n=1 Tax=Volvox carteri f. nagariensis TaxID=3068 RepID=Q9SBM3_VOLCA|nr:CF0 ATP synthase subunit II precursor [Volvox carteri f. nagariensis]AAD55575.1 CFO ATP synthase subunit II precursor [Volvox carteri f. nagariensis]EFJ41776.1 CF0 ATP synthase subunit II precursor [Volvox carteri f. nagariensis]|eukprot:XP_002957122.1 CF0 ATP synthase subunit II precursor [Volvox carteri f. nagariensis]